MSSESTKHNGRGPWTLPLLGAVFLGPLVLAALLYYGMDTWQPAEQSHHGQLFDPARPLPPFVVARTVGKKTGSGLFRGKWTLLHIGHGACESRCMAVLLNMRQIRLALGKELGRVQHVLLHRGPARAKEAISVEHPDLIFAEADLQRNAEFLNAFTEYRQHGLFDAGRIYIIDPLGNLVLSYQQGVDPSGILQDLKRLLRLSRIG